MSSLRILLLEDNLNDVQLVQHQLNDMGIPYTIDHATDEETFKSSLTKGKPDIIISDQKLPGYNGFTAFYKLKELGLDIPFILVSGYMTNETKDKVIELGINDYLDKNSLARLPQSIRRVLYLNNKAQLKHDPREKNYLSENRFRLIAENSSDMITSTSIEGIFTYVSPSCREILGYRPEEMIGKQGYDYIHPEDIEKVEKEHLAILGSKTKKFVEFRMRKKDGSYAWMETTAQPVLSNTTGEILEMVAICRDVTERVKRERHLKQTQYLLTEAQQLANIGSWSINLVKDKLFWSDNLKKLVGASADCIPTLKGYLAMIHPDDKEMMIKTLDKARKSGKRYENEYRIIRKDGAIRYFHAVASFELDKAGKPVRMFGVCHDITERKEKEAKLLDTESKLLEAQKMAQFGNWDFYPQTGEMLWSPGTKIIYGIDENEDIDYATFISLIHPEDLPGLQKLTDVVPPQGKPIDHVFRIIRPNGEIRTVHEIMKCEFDNKGNISRMYGTTQDITESCKRKEKLLQTEQLLQEAQKMAQFGNWNFDAKAKEVYWSEGIRRIYGLDEDDPVDYELFLSAIHPEDFDRVSKTLTEGHKIGKKVDHKFRIVRLDGEIRILHDIVNTELDNKGNILRIYGTSQDITELETANAQLKNTLNELEQRVDQRTKMLSTANKLLKDEIEDRISISKILEQKNKDIIESITYAKRLQKAILPTIEKITRSFKDSFVLNKPKDIVSGDFYWLHKTRQKSMIACCDCTGHGVPGAFMSLLGADTLDRIVKDQEWKYPSLVLELVDSEICATLNGSGKDIVDGMDMVFCEIDHAEKKISFAGAMNPILIARKTGEVEVFKGSRYSLGGYLCTGEKRFETHEITYEEGDMLYMFSDGYQDQFGGKNGKKFRFKGLHNLIESISKLPANEQQNVFNQTFEDWKGNNDQIDDVLIIGLRLQ